MPLRQLFAFIFCVHLFGCLSGVGFAQIDAFESAPIRYSETEAADRVALLGNQMADDPNILEFDDRYGYLPSLLSRLDIPESSQTLVFSKTSLQIRRISPEYPRALYFNDDVYVGYCHRGDILEIAATDPNLGAVFYTLSQKKSDKPTLSRDPGQCLACHATGRTPKRPRVFDAKCLSESNRPPDFAKRHVHDQT